MLPATVEFLDRARSGLLNPLVVHSCWKVGLTRDAKRGFVRAMDIVEHVRAAGERRNSLPAQGASRFAVLTAAALMVASVRDPVHRPLGRVGALLVGAAALLTYVVSASAVTMLAVAGASLVVVPVVFFLALALGSVGMRRVQTACGSAAPPPAVLPPGSWSTTGSGC